MGGSPPRAPTPPSPEEVARAQAEAQAREQERLRVERAGFARDFLGTNALSEDFRSGVFSASDEAANTQLALLRGSTGTTLQDIRQRNAARGLSDSSSGLDLRRKALSFADASRNDIFNQSRRRGDARIREQQAFLDSGANTIRGGRSVESAQAQFQTDIGGASAAFEEALARASTGNQRNSAFQDFERTRQAAANRFNESVNQFETAGLLAAGLTNTSEQDEKFAQGQGFTAGLS
jgi:hypothetical protein